MVATELWWRDPVTWGLALWGGLVAAAAFPPAGLWPLAVLAPAPLFAAAARCRLPRRAALYGLCYGIGFFAVLLWWIVPTVVRYGQLPWSLGGICLLALACYLALYPSLVAAACALAAGINAGWALVLAPLLWTGAEWVRGFLCSGFPWGDLPQALWQVGLALDLAPWCGIDGVRLLLAGLAVLPAWCLLALAEARQPRGRRVPPVALLPALAAAAAWGGGAMSAGMAEPGGVVEVGVVQGNIDQNQKWDPAYRQRSLEIYADLSRQAVASGNGATALLVWPETSVPLYAQDPGPERQRIAALTRELGCALLFGAPAYERTPQGTVYRNAVFLLDAGGRLRARYDKVHLVPFGEYVPFGRYLPFLKKLVHGAGDFTPGPAVVPLPAVDDLPSIGPLVCFEVIFPDLAAQHVRRGGRLLAVLTNDGWFGTTPGPYQHLAFAAWRAAENGVPLVRAANTGISAVFDARGRLLRASKLNQPEGFSVAVAVPDGPSQARPWWRRQLGPLCLWLAGAALFAIFLSLRRQRAVVNGDCGGGQ